MIANINDAYYTESETMNEEEQEIIEEEIPIMEYPQVAGFTPVVIAEDKGE